MLVKLKLGESTHKLSSQSDRCRGQQPSSECLFSKFQDLHLDSEEGQSSCSLRATTSLVNYAAHNRIKLIKPHSDEVEFKVLPAVSAPISTPTFDFLSTALRSVIYFTETPKNIKLLIIDPFCLGVSPGLSGMFFMSFLRDPGMFCWMGLFLRGTRSIVIPGIFRIFFLSIVSAT